MIKKFLVITFFAAMAADARALSVKHDFTAFIGPFNASTAEFEYVLQPHEYAVRSTVRTNGTFNLLYPFEAQYFTGGRIENGRMETAAYRYKSKSRFSKRSKEMVYDRDGQPVYSISTKNGKQKKKTIEVNADNKNTTNLQTVLAAIAKHYNEVRFCDSEMRIFDGKKRYNVIFRDEGTEELKADDNSPFSGAAAKCSMYIDKLGDDGDDLLWQLSSERPVYFWILRDSKTAAPFIARIKIKETPLGEMNVYTTKIEVKK